MSEPRICVVVPAYNEGRAIQHVLRTAANVASDILVIDDGSTDDTADRVKEIPGVHLLEHPANRGKGAAIRTAITWVLQQNYDAALFMDADGQHDPGEIPRFTRSFAETGADLIVGSRMADNRAMPIVRKASNRFSSFLISRLAGAPVTDSQSGYRLLSARLLTALRDSGGEGFDFESEMIIDAVRDGMRYEEVPITCIYGEEQSHYHPVRDSAQFLVLVIRKALDIQRNKRS